MLGVKLLFKGKIKESYCHFSGGFVRIIEALRDTFRKPKVKCNYCGWEGYKFKTLVATVNLRKNAVCPKCLSLDRHRTMLNVFTQVKSQLNLREIKVLDIAPNIAFSNYCKSISGINYLSVDLQSQYAMKHMDVQHLDLPDNEFDVIVCYHVLDYVKDDIQGMREIRRVLKETGVAITQEGIYKDNEKTEEWGKPMPEEQYRIRKYGKDFFKRWETAGFKFIYLDEKNILLSGKNIQPSLTISF